MPPVVASRLVPISMHRMKKQNWTDLKVLTGMMAIISIPFALTLMTVVRPRTPLDISENPTPYGYTWSLTLFVLPVIVLGCWLARRRESRIQNLAFWITTAFVALSGVLLDTFFALTFFKFPNRGAVLGTDFYGYSFTDGWQRRIPVEEIGFYVFGALAVLLTYVWGDEFWFGAYNVDDASRRQARARDLFSFHPASAIFGVFILILGLLFKKFGPHSYHEGFPGYFFFLTSVALTPSIVFFPVASTYINWRAFSLGLLFILLVSLFWEATIAVPYQWWDFQDKEMLGLRINGFSGLPIEEPTLWFGVTWATVIMYETVYTFLFARRGSIQVP
jgi:hypothetical protein